MPAIFDHFVSYYHLTPHKAWRYSFLVPFAVITGTAILMLVLCPDTPTGSWSDRADDVKHNLEAEHNVGHVVPHSGLITDAPAAKATSISEKEKGSESNVDIETSAGEMYEVDAEYTHEVIQSPTASEILKVAISPQVIALGLCYMCSFGAELAINSILG
jgi:MFS transporter, NNP family, nitrate/nitrite transporter